MTSVTIGSNVKKIGSGAFMNCRNLTRVTVTAKGLTSIGKKCVQGRQEIKNSEPEKGEGSEEGRQGCI